ncbi:MAG: asparaginase domain-containing protein [Patescibacteria group bacterium]
MNKTCEPLKVYVINTGGTLGMTGRPLRPAKSAHELLEGLNLPKRVETFLVDVPIMLDSTNLMHRDRVALGYHIRDVYFDYDAFVIFHGTDSLAETCAFLTMLFRGSLQKPILVIGAQMGKDEPGSEVHSQIESTMKVAKTFARKGIVGVFNVCIDDVLDGSRVRKRNESDKNAFYTPGRQIVAKAWPHVSIMAPLRRYDAVAELNGLQLFPGFEQHVCTLGVSADAPPHVLMDLVRAGRLKGIILEGKGAGNIPDRVWSPQELNDTESYSWIDAIAAATRAGMHVGIISPFDDGRVILTRYELGMKAKESGALSLESLTPAMGDVKFRMAIAAYPNQPDDIQSFLSTNFLRELLESQEDDDEDE